MDVYLKNRVDMAELTGSLARWYFEPATAAVRIRPGSHEGPAKPCAGCASAWDCTARRASGVEGKLTLLVSMLGRAL